MVRTGESQVAAFFFSEKRFRIPGGDYELILTIESARVARVQSMPG
jgi:hypothetical protein